MASSTLLGVHVIVTRHCQCYDNKDSNYNANSYPANHDAGEGLSAIGFGGGGGMRVNEGGRGRTMEEEGQQGKTREDEGQRVRIRANKGGRGRDKEDEANER